MKNFSRRHKGLLIVLSAVMLFSCIFTADYLCNWGVFSAKAAATDYSNIRVYLKTMDGQTSVPFSVSGKYSISGITGAYEFRNGVMLRENVNYTLKAVNGNVVLSDGNDDYTLGSDVTFYSHLAGRNYYFTIAKNPYNGKCNYIGNMRVYVKSGALAFINTLQLDDYLCGVVAYEMSNGQEVESLKVQAVCARSYAYNTLSKSQKKEYDVVDTTANQVYKGFRAEYGRCIKAVDETAYQILTYNGKCISTYYSSSNGGLTENNKNAWGSTKLPYLNVNIDEYDNKYQDVEYTLSKTNFADKNSTMFKNKLKTEIVNEGYDFDSLKIVSIDSIVTTYASEPASLEASERRIYSMCYNLTVKAKKTDSEDEETLAKSVTLLRESARTSIYLTNKSGKTVTLPSTKIKVYENSDSFTFIVDGNGHGIGMSQNGTYERVKAGQTYDEILEFYFNGTDIKTLQFESYIYEPIPSNSHIDTQASTIKTLEKTKVGTVNANAYLYSNAGAIYDITTAIEEGKGVTVVSETANWYGIVVGDNEYTGFVMKEFVDIYEDIVIDNIVGEFVTGITLGDVSVRSEPNFDADVVGTYEKDTQITIISSSDSFFGIIYDGVTAYVPMTEIKFTGVKSYFLFEGRVMAYKAPVFADNGETDKKLGYLTNNTKIEIFDVSGDSDYYRCIYNGVYAYIKKSDIEYNTNSVGTIIPENSSAVDLSVKLTADTGIYSSSELNDENRIGELFEGDIVRVVAKIDGTYKIIFGENEAYISSENTLEYSKNVIKIIATAKSDTLLYSNSDLDNITGSAKKGEKLTVIGQTNGVLMVEKGSGVYYVAEDCMSIKYSEIYIFG